MPLFDPTTYSPEQAAQLKNVPGQSLAATNTPQQIAAAQGTPQQNAPQVPQTPTQTSTGFQNPPTTFGFAQILDTMRGKLAQNQDIINQKNLLLKSVYDQQLTPEELQKLTPSQINAIQSNNRNLVDLEVRVLNDNLKGRTDTLDQSINFLTQQYQTSQTDLENKRQQAIDNITGHIATLQQQGIDPTQYFNSVYGKDYLSSLGIDLSGISGTPSTFTPSGTGDRTQRNNNPTAFTTDVAKQAGLVLGKDYTQGDPFTGPNGQTLYTAKLLGDPIQQTIKLIDKIGFYTKDGTPRWSYINQIPEAKNWASLSQDQKVAVVNKMNQFESGSPSGQVSAPTLQQIQQKVPGLTQADYSLATQVVDGLLAPSELSKRAATYSKTLAAAQEYSKAKYGTDFNIAQANRKFNFANQKSTQDTLNYLLSLTGDSGAPGNLDELKAQSNQITRTDFPALNNTAAWTKLQTGDPAIASYYATVTEVADQVAKILQGGGTGSGTSDSKLAQAQSLFQARFSKNQLNAVIDALNPLLKNRATSIVKDNPYLSDYASRLNITGGSSDQTQSVSAGSVINYQGKNYTVDANGNLTPVQ